MTNQAHGTWQVTTEGDVEGRTIKNLGTFTGYVDEIALYLADKCYYTLEFKRVALVKEFKPTKSVVNIRVIDFEIFEHTKQLLSGRPVKVTSGNYYNSTNITAINKKELEKEIAREKALSKLTKEDKEALGL